MSKRNNRRGPRKTYYPTRNQTSKKLFHSPQAYGELIKIPMTPAMQAISVISLIIQAALTAFTIYLAFTTDTIAVLENTGFSSSYLYLTLPAVTWLLSLGFRFTCRAVPLEMWRLPKSVKQGVIKTGGTPLKLVTLLAELETAVCFCYIAVILYLGQSPSSVILLLWLAALALSVYFPCRAAARQA